MSLPRLQFKPRLASSWRARAAGNLFWLVLLLAWIAGAQMSPPSSRDTVIGTQPPNLSKEVAPFGEDDPYLNEQRLRMLNLARQKSLVNDTNKLLKLAAELNAELAASGPGGASAAQVKKVGEIEKLAHSVKEKMSLSVRATPEWYRELTPQRTR